MDLSNQKLSPAKGHLFLQMSSCRISRLGRGVERVGNVRNEGRVSRIDHPIWGFWCAGSIKAVSTDYVRSAAMESQKVYSVDWIEREPWRWMRATKQGRKCRDKQIRPVQLQRSISPREDAVVGCKGRSRSVADAILLSSRAGSVDQ